MESKASWYRLGVSLLVLALAFIGVQTLDWSLNASAEATAPSPAALVAVPHSPNVPAADTYDISIWGFGIVTNGGYFRLTADISGTSGTGVIVSADNVTILGNGHSILGDGVQETSSAIRETGIQINSCSGVSVRGVAFRKLDTGIQSTNTGPVRDLLFDANTFDLLTTGIQWMNASSVRSVSIKNNTVDSTANYGLDWSNNGSSSSSDSLFVQNNRFTNINSGYGYGVRVSNMGSARNTSISNDTFSGNKQDVTFYHDGDSTAGLNVNNNLFQNSGRPVYIANYSGMPMSLSGVTVNGNTCQGNTYPGTPSPGFPNGHINLYGGGNNIQVRNNTIQSGTNMSGIRVAGGSSSYAYPFYQFEFANNLIQGLMGNDGTGQAAGGHFFNIADSVAAPMPASLAPLAALASTQPTIRDNSFINNSGPGISYTKGISNPLPQIDARQNWWGDAAGPNGPNGDGVSANVLFDPWLTSPPPKCRIYLPLVLRNQ